VFKKIRYYFQLRKQNWEKICKKCGLCCYNRDIVRGKLVIKYHMACEYLNKSTNLCNVYMSRFKKCKECRKVTMFHAIFSRYMPRTCSYVQKYRFKKSNEYYET